MADVAHDLTDKKLEEMERRISAIYSRAEKEIQKRADEFFNQFKRLDEAKAKQVEAGQLSEKDYKTWRRNKILYSQRFTEMKEQAAKQLLNVNKTAVAYINDQLPEVYSVNYNALEEIVDGVGGYSFTLTDPQTIRHLALTDASLLPFKEIDPAKDIPWNMKKINAEVLQGIITGDSIPKIAARISTVQTMNENAAIRSARTIVTEAENKGRLDSYIQAEKDGIELRRVWISTDDARTRPWHAELDGKDVALDEPWENSVGKIMFPGDPTADGANVYNCRCTQIAKVMGFNGQKIVEAAEDLNLEKFVPAGTIKEAEAYAHKFAKDVSYKGAKSLDAVNEVNQTLSSLHDRFPLADFKTVKTNGRLKNAMARANFQEIEIKTSFLDGKYAEDSWAEQLKRDAKQLEKYKGYLNDPIYDPAKVKKAIKELEEELKYDRWAYATKGIKETLSHEYGHALADQYIGQINGSYANPHYSNRASNPLKQKCNEIEEAYKKAKKTGDIYKISVYGGTNQYEFFAETFSMYANGEKLPDYIEKVIKEVAEGGVL